jgi:hypothetical protein
MRGGSEEIDISYIYVGRVADWGPAASGETSAKFMRRVTGTEDVSPQCLGFSTLWGRYILRIQGVLYAHTILKLVPAERAVVTLVAQKREQIARVTSFRTNEIAVVDQSDLQSPEVEYPFIYGRFQTLLTPEQMQFGPNLPDLTSWRIGKDGSEKDIEGVFVRVMIPGGKEDKHSRPEMK